MPVPWSREQPPSSATRIALDAHLDEQAEVRSVSHRNDGTTSHIRIKPARALEYVRLHVQTNATYNAAVSVSSERIRCAGERVIDRTVTRDGVSHYYAFIIPSGTDPATGGELRFDGTAGHADDYMSYIDLGV
jgi:hypothetical protein